MEAQNNNQPTLDNHNNLYKIPGQEDQVGHLTYLSLDRFNGLLIEKKLNVICSKFS